ncbi:glomulin [Bombina bombina]|uniref:glomulin n=1 Tax=Bombina bombina TaxID=8345 RepID=UPI00235AB2ED|nr:glomulin [Bombina bombina]
MAVEDLQTIIQKLQNLSEDDFKEEEINVFLVTCQKCLDEEKTELMLEMIQDIKNQAIIKSMGWNLIGPIAKHLQCYINDVDKRRISLKMIECLVQVCSAKEILLGLLEQIDETEGEDICQVILLLLQPLQTVLLKLGNKKAYSVGLSLSTLLSRLSSLPVPYTKEQILEDKHALCQCCGALLQFTKPFVDIVSQSNDLSQEPDIQELRKELLTFCFSCLNFPLLSAPLNLLPDDAEDHAFRLFAKEILRYFVLLGEPLSKAFLQQGYKIPKSEDEDLGSKEVKRSDVSIPCLAYLVFVQHFGIDDFPFVFGPSFLVKTNMENVDVLLKRTDESILSKGLELLESSLIRVENESLHHDLLEVRTMLSVLQDLVKVMTLCPIEHLRKKSLTMLQLLIDKFSIEGKYQLFRCLLITSNHAGVDGYIIQNIKNQIDLALKEESSNKWFLGPRLIPLLHMVFSLPQGAETDLLQNSDKIMASLNLLRYLIIKDNDAENKTGVWTELSKIDPDYLKPLHTGLNMSKAHYEAEMRNTSEKKKAPHLKNTVCTVTAGGRKLPDMTPNMQLQVLQSALFTFDLMESVLARVEELIEVKIKSASDEKIGSSKDV